MQRRGRGGGDNAERQRSTNQHFRPLHNSSLSVHIFMQKQIMTDSSHPPKDSYSPTRHAT